MFIHARDIVADRKLTFVKQKMRLTFKLTETQKRRKVRDVDSVGQFAIK